jgi:hypothetical protein
MIPLWVKYKEKDKVAILVVVFDWHLYRKQLGLIAAIVKNP